MLPSGQTLWMNLALLVTAAGVLGWLWKKRLWGAVVLQIFLVGSFAVGVAWFVIPSTHGALGNCVVPGVVALASALRSPALRGEVQWWRRGIWDSRVIAWTIGIALTTAAVLVGWWKWSHGGFPGMLSTVGERPGATLVAMALLFPVMNALMEEVVYRGFILHGFMSVGIPPRAAVILQGVIFGAVHFYGFPSGWVGITLASVYGVVLGRMRLRWGGMLGVVCAHSGADLTIFLIAAAAGGRT
jgi:membrane protease YdiL (CAAX protease family)